MSSLALGKEIYDRDADAWWDADAPAFRSLRAVKAFHLEALSERFGPRLAQLRTVDLGAGGGLLAAPLARAGATVVAVDLSLRSLAACARATSHDARAPRLVCGDANRVPLPDEFAELVLATDLLEHVTAPGDLLREVARILKPGSVAFVATINRTFRARLLAVHLAEGLGLVPRGTHDSRHFVRPHELAAQARAAGLVVDQLFGAAVRPFATVRRRAITLRRSASLAVAYCAFLRKPESNS